MTRLGRRAALVSALGAAAGVLARPARAAPQDPVAALWGGIELQGVDGRTLQASGARLLHLWAHWCPACLGEMGSLAEAARTLAVDVVLVSHPEFWPADQAFARRQGWPFRLAVPSAANTPAAVEAAMLEGSGEYTVPRSLLFEAGDRRLVWSHTGALAWSAPGTMARLRAALSG